MNDIRKNNTNVKITPRFLFNDFNQNTFNAFLYNEKLQESVINNIVSLLMVKIFKINILF